jgi:hypothetical protein
MEQVPEQQQPPQQQQQQQQQESEAGTTAGVPVQSAQENITTASQQQQQQQQEQQQQSDPINDTSSLQQLPQHNGISLPVHQPADPNGMDMGLGLGQLDVNGFVLPQQHMGFPTGTNGITFSDPSLLLMASQQLAMGGIAPQPMNTNGTGNGISAGKLATLRTSLQS